MNTAPALTIRDLETRIEAARREAGEDYVNRGVAAYADRGALRSDLCLLHYLALTHRVPTRMTLAELVGLEAAGAITAVGPYAKLTAEGAELAAAALIAANA